MAQAPATCGVAIEVPDSSWYWAPGWHDKMSTPGAARSTVVTPKLEKSASTSFWSVAATAMMFGESYPEG